MFHPIQFFPNTWHVVSSVYPSKIMIYKSFCVCGAPPWFVVPAAGFFCFLSFTVKCAVQFFFRADLICVGTRVSTVASLQEGSDPVPPLPSSGQKVSYQTDPRPHFGVAWSSHSTCRPLWGSEGPCWGQRNEEVADQTHTCPHCHLGLAPDTLRWHEVGTDACKHTRTQIETQFPANSMYQEPECFFSSLHRPSVYCSRASGTQRDKKWNHLHREVWLELFIFLDCLLLISYLCHISFHFEFVLIQINCKSQNLLHSF